jgi:hypothetical protein
MDIRAFFQCRRMISRTRDVAAANETKDIAAILHAIQTRTPAGCRIMTAFKEKTGLDITGCRGRSGTSRGTHYDFEIEVNNTWKKVEHKGSIVYRIPTWEESPWKAGVQFHNGGCEKYSLARKYARTWYDIHIASDALRNEFGITAPTPTFEDWFENDCRVQSDPRTAFGKELKEKVRQVRGPKESLLDKRAAVIDALEITDEDKKTLIQEVLPIVKQVLLQKDYWLSIYGRLDGDFHAVWQPQITIDSIENVIVEKKKDIEFRFWYPNNKQFYGILRWGKGAGFSCLRIDLK